MRVTLAAATFAIAALVAAPATAEMGGPVKQGAQCWKGAKTQDVGTFGSWSACADPASTPAATSHRRAQHQHH
jgi:hypothetical protein